MVALIKVNRQIVESKLKMEEWEYFSLKMILLQTGVTYLVGFEILETQSGQTKTKINVNTFSN